DLMGVRGVALSGRHKHDREGEVLRRDDGGIAVLARAAGADKTMLRAFVPLDLGVLERRPVRLLLAEAADEFLHDLLDRDADQFRRTLMPCDAHGQTPVRRDVAPTLFQPRRASTNPSPEGEGGERSEPGGGRQAVLRYQSSNSATHHVSLPTFRGAPTRPRAYARGHPPPAGEGYVDRI